jgi:diphthamide synthase (EF-2-diphthine--ammonia ligase)
MRVVVLFSGGPDSVLSALLAWEELRPDHMLLATYDNGVLLNVEKARLNYAQVRRRVECDLEWRVFDVHGLFHRWGLRGLERRILRFGWNPVCLDCKFCMLYHALERLDPDVIVTGDRRSRDYPEQTPAAKEFWEEMCGEYGVEYRTPVWGLEKREVYEGLVERRVSVRGSEPKCMLAGSWKQPVDEEKVERYLEGLRKRLRGLREATRPR